MADDKKTIEPIDAPFDDVAKAMLGTAPAVDMDKFLAKMKRAREAANEMSARTNIADLIERDACWAVMRSRAGEALQAFC